MGKKNEWETFRGSLHREWGKNRKSPIRRLRNWIGPINKTTTAKLHLAKGFLDKHPSRESKHLHGKIVSEISQRSIPQENICENEESCVFTIIGNIKAFLNKKGDFHHPNKKDLVKQASALLDDCFECKRSIYDIREQVGSKDEINSAIQLIDAQIDALQKRMKPIADEVFEYTSELERLASILRKY